MKRTRDTRRPKGAAAEKPASGGEDANQMTAGGQPRSWKEYIEQTMPVKEKKAETEQNVPPPQAGPDIKEEAGKLLDRLVQRAETAWNRARVRAERLYGRIAGNQGKVVQTAARFRGMMARHPVSPLLYVTLMAVCIGAAAFHGTYARAYVLEINGQEVAVVSGQDAEAILGSVEVLYGSEAEVTLAPVFAAPDALSDAAEVEGALLAEAENAPDGGEEAACVTAYALSVDGEELGFAADKNELYQMLDEIAQDYLPENAVRYEFVEDVEVRPVEVPEDTEFDLTALRDELSALEVEEASYEVEQGDTFNAIAYSLDMDPNELSILNPDVIVSELWVGQELVIQQAVPRLSVTAVVEESYEEAIPSPVEYIDTDELYVGETKVKEEGEDGLAQVSAQATYVNGVEMEREVLESTVVKEATTTYTYNGTAVRPVTASNGYFIWPVRGTLTSYFGGRTLGGVYDFHLGIDIAVPYGTPIQAADGGTIIKAGWNGSYGILVAIQHDNGTVTYYGHNSSALVSVGEKVYQGQTIALAGSTGNSTGNHCHFEVRVNGTSVNPLNYLS